jgi:hypothetical protein
MRKTFVLLATTLSLSACASLRPQPTNQSLPASPSILPYISATQHSTRIPTNTPELISEPYVFVDETMIVRNGPGVEFDVIEQIPPRKKYPVIGKYVDWWLINLGNNQVGWIYGPVNVTNFVGDPHRGVPYATSPPTPTPEITPTCSASTLQPGNVSEVMEEARKTLITFFELLNSREYERAVSLYGGGYEILRDWNPLIDPKDHAALLKNGCEVNGLRCLRIKHIVQEKYISQAKFSFVLEFMNNDGSLFVRGPCCGADATSMPPQSQFTYLLIRDCTGKLLVLDLPVYVP